MIRSKITSHINQTETAELAAFLDKTEECSYEQFPGFAQAAYAQKLRYYFQYGDGVLNAFCVIRRRRYFFAEILFGPLVHQPQHYETAVSDLISQLRKKGIFLLRIMPPSFAIDHAGAKSADSGASFNWSTLLLDIKNRSSQELLGSFADRHKWSIKKALKNNLAVTEITGKDDIELFSSNYILMYGSRSLPVQPEVEKKKFKQLFQCFQQHQNGFFLGVTNEQQQQIGGCCIVLQGNTAYYYKGYVHPGFRNLPVSHLALFRAIEIAVAKNKSVFDFGGYALDTQPGDQLYNINLFKAGFGGSKIDYPLTRIYYLNVLVKRLFPFLNAIRKKWSKGGGHEN